MTREAVIAVAKKIIALGAKAETASPSMWRDAALKLGYSREARKACSVLGKAVLELHEENEKLRRELFDATVTAMTSRAKAIAGDAIDREFHRVLFEQIRGERDVLKREIETLRVREKILNQSKREYDVSYRELVGLRREIAEAPFAYGLGPPIDIFYLGEKPGVAPAATHRAKLLRMEPWKGPT